MQIKSTEGAYKLGACEKLFDSVQVTATGMVNACACRDVDASLTIGDVNATPLAEILSPETRATWRSSRSSSAGSSADLPQLRFLQEHLPPTLALSARRYRGDDLSEFKEQLAARRANVPSTTTETTT